MISKADIEKMLKMINDATDIGANQFKASIRAVYIVSKKQPYHIGSCILLSVNKKKYLLTAAHVIDESKRSPLCIYGEGNKLVRVMGKFLLTNKPESGRVADHYDVAWGHASDELIKLLGENDFIPEEKITNCVENSEGRIYLALGYPCSKNKPNTFKKRITPAYFRYADTVKVDKDLCQKLNVLGTDHFFLNYNFKHSKNGRGDLINSIEPRGLSGGALVDMGTFVDWSKATDNPTGKLAGMLIEEHKEYNAIIAVKISKIVNLIKAWQAKVQGEISGCEV